MTRLPRFALGALAALALGAPAYAETPACPAADEVVLAHLLGEWHAEVEGFAQHTTLLLEKHPDFAETFRGSVTRGVDRAQLAGDVDDGEFTMEESANGANISATWLGDVVEGSCGREIRGNWQAEGDSGAHPFVLRKR